MPKTIAEMLATGLAQDDLPLNKQVAEKYLAELLQDLEHEGADYEKILLHGNEQDELSFQIDMISKRENIEQLSAWIDAH